MNLGSALALALSADRNSLCCDHKFQIHSHSYSTHIHKLNHRQWLALSAWQVTPRPFPVTIRMHIQSDQVPSQITPTGAHVVSPRHSIRSRSRGYHEKGASYGNHKGFKSQLQCRGVSQPERLRDCSWACGFIRRYKGEKMSGAGSRGYRMRVKAWKRNEQTGIVLGGTGLS